MQIYLLQFVVEVSVPVTKAELLASVLQLHEEGSTNVNIVHQSHKYVTVKVPEHFTEKYKNVYIIHIAYTV
jgi:hypothetical protein